MREIDKKLFDAVSGMDTKLVQDLIAAGANIMARSAGRTSAVIEVA